MLFHPLRVRALRPEAEDALVIAFAVPEALRERFAFEPGQHLTLRHVFDGVEERRSYSICAGLDDGELRVGVRRVDGGRFSGWLHAALREGDTLEVMPPQGRFVLRPQPSARRHLLAIAGGAGITPILSIVKTLLAREPGSRATLLYANRRSGTTMFKEELEDLKNRHLTRLAIHTVFSREPVDAPLNAGRLDRVRLHRFLTTLIDPAAIDLAYLCGPHALNDEAEAALREAGVPAAAIHVERFGVPGAATPLPAGAPAAAGADAHALLSVTRDGLTREVSVPTAGTSLLQAAAAGGLDVPYSCRSGVCGTCRAKLLDGEVAMARNFALEPAEVAAGFVLTCQAHARTARVAVSFDER